MGENFFVFASERATGIEPATFSLGNGPRPLRHMTDA
jgi:hypothetical protein